MSPEKSPVILSYSHTDNIPCGNCNDCSPLSILTFLPSYFLPLGKIIFILFQGGQKSSLFSDTSMKNIPVIVVTGRDSTEHSVVIEC